MTADELRNEYREWLRRDFANSLTPTLEEYVVSVVLPRECEEARSVGFEDGQRLTKAELEAEYSAWQTKGGSMKDHIVGAGIVLGSFGTITLLLLGMIYGMQWVFTN